MTTPRPDVTVHLTEGQHRELLALIVHYSTGKYNWAITPGLRLAVASAKEEES